MPTELPDLSSELARRYNEQQRELHAFRQQLGSPTDPVESERLKSELRELNQQLDADRRQCAEQKDAFDADARRLEGELAAIRRAEQTALELVVRLENQLRESHVKFDNEVARLRSEAASNQTAPAGVVQDLKRQLAELQARFDTEAARAMAELAECRGAKTPPGLTPAELARRLKDLRKEVTRYSVRLKDLRGFESSISTRLGPEQLYDLVEALSKELNGMMERYQALSLWEKTEAREGT